MRNLNLIQTKENGLFVNRLFYDHFENPLIEKSWDGLFENETYENEIKSPYLNFGINNSLYEDNIIFSTLIWRLLKNKRSFGIPNYYRDEAKKIIKKDFEFINWEFDLSYEYGMNSPKDNGFIKANSCIPLNPKPSDWQRKHKEYAGLFNVESYNDIIGLELATFGDATSEISFFGLESIDKSDLVGLLKQRRKPELVNIVSDKDIFIDLVIGHDQGYFNCLSIYSFIDISDQIKIITEDLYTKCKKYEANIDKIKNIDEFTNEMKIINSY